jgi:hypothetical protein
LHDKESNNLYTSPNIIRMVKSRMTRWETRVARIRGKTYKILTGKPAGKRPRAKTKALMGM